MSECIFCQIADGDLPANIAYQDADVIAFHDLDPQAPTHILVIPRKHFSTLLDMDEEQTLLLGKLQLAAVEIARQQGLDREGFRIVTNCLESAGQSVFHLHVHLLGGRAFTWPPG
jgi:histidine triad (HIT) family protein